VWRSRCLISNWKTHKDPLPCGGRARSKTWFGLISLAGLFLSLVAPVCQAGEVVVTIDVRTPGPRFEGWGTSLAWWAERIGDWPDDKLDPMLKLITDPDTGLGMNVFRFNIGGGDKAGHHHMRRGAQIPGYRPEASAAYDWSADPNQRRILLKLARACTNTIFEAISYSPPWWMTVSGCSSGSSNGAPNLADDKITAYADYLAAVVEHYRAEHGIVFRSATPMNEPDENWWKADGKQEGCSLTIAQQKELIVAMSRSLRNHGLTQTLVAVTDGNSFERVAASVRELEPDPSQLGGITTHSYHDAGRAELRALAQRLHKPLWQSESGPLAWKRMSPWETALGMAARTIRDLNELQPADWLMWQVSEGGNWGALGDFPDEQRFVLKEQFYTLRQFTRFIRPGDALLPLNSEFATAAFSSDRRALTVVLVNTQAGRTNCLLELLGASGLPDSAQVVQVGDSTRTGEKFSVQKAGSAYPIELAPTSVTAVRWDNIRL